MRVVCVNDGVIIKHHGWSRILSTGEGLIEGEIYNVVGHVIKYDGSLQYVLQEFEDWDVKLYERFEPIDFDEFEEVIEEKKECDAVV